MVIVAFCSIIALILTYAESIGRIRNGMKCGFVLVTILGVMHYDYGNDYMAYYRLYNDIVSHSFNFNDLWHGYIYKEPGWAIINYLFKYLGGFFIMVAVLNVIQNVLYYRFIKNNVSRSLWPLAIFIYLFSTNYYLLNFSMMRQGLAIAIFLGVWELIRDKRWFWALCGILCAYLVHSSALVLLPFAFWGYIPFKKGKLTALIFIALFVVLWVSQDLMNEIFTSMLVFDDIQEYANYYTKEDVSISYGIGFLINLIPFTVALYYFFFNRGQDMGDNNLVALSTVGFMIVPFTQVLPLVSRVAMYFNVFSISTVGLTYYSIRSKPIRYGLLSLFILIMLYDYWLFFTTGVFTESYLNFKSVFSILYDKIQMFKYLY